MNLKEFMNINLELKICLKEKQYGLLNIALELKSVLRICLDLNIRFSELFSTSTFTFSPTSASFTVVIDYQLFLYFTTTSRSSITSSGPF